MLLFDSSVVLIKKSIMRKLSLLLVVLISGISYNSFSSERTPTEIIDQREIKRQRYILRTDMLEVIVLNMTYGDNFIVSEFDKKKLKDAEVQLVELIFSDYPKDLDLKKLNLSRIKVVEAMKKSIVTDYSVQWRVIRQMDCKNEAEAKTLFHGIVIHYKPYQSEEEKKKELDKVVSFLPPESELTDLRKVRNSVSDSTIFKVFERKKNWKDMMVVADLTGSMAPFTAQLTLWFKLHENDHNIKNLVFFNDGDMTPDAKKIIGKTGGIYDSKETSYEKVRELALKTIDGGCGGDIAENNIEALLHAQNLNPDAKELIMIADNSANVKDLVLLKDVKKPVRVILCGTGYGVNLDYLTIAFKTGGSVHTMEKDLEDLIKKKEGQVFEFMGQNFQIKNGEIIKIIAKKA